MRSLGFGRVSVDCFDKRGSYRADRPGDERHFLRGIYLAAISQIDDRRTDHAAVLPSVQDISEVYVALHGEWTRRTYNSYWLTVE